MPKMKTNKSISKRVKLTSSGKMLRRHQLGAGHLKRNKTKGAKERQSQMAPVYKSEARKWKKLLGL